MFDPELMIIGRKENAQNDGYYLPQIDNLRITQP